MCHLEEFFHKKLKYVRKLCLDENLILKGLTDGFNAEYRNVLFVNSPSIATEWYKVVSRLVPVQRILVFQ